MDKELHEKALEEARKAQSLYAGVAKIAMEKAIAAYLKTAGLTVVPVEPTETMLEAGNERSVSDVRDTGTAYPSDIYETMLAAFPSPFDEGK